MRFVLTETLKITTGKTKPMLLTLLFHCMIPTPPASALLFCCKYLLFTRQCRRWMGVLVWLLVSLCSVEWGDKSLKSLKSLYKLYIYPFCIKVITEENQSLVEWRGQILSLFLTSSNQRQQKMVRLLCLLFVLLLINDLECFICFRADSFLM